MDIDALRAKAVILGHRRGHASCGWTGMYRELKSRRMVDWSPKPVCTCPHCGLTLPLQETQLFPSARTRFATAK